MEENKQKIQDKEIYFREKILEFIHKIEKEKDVIIIYACETGSRGWGTHVKDSDFDIKGYFICSREKYLSIPGSPEIIDQTHFELNMDGVNYDVDFEFNDIKVFFKNKCERQWKNTLNYKFFTNEEDIYINRFQKDDLNLIKSNVSIDLQLWISIMVGYHKHFFYMKNPNPENKFGKKIRAKDVVNCLIFNAQFLYILEKKEFPPYKYKNLIQELKGMGEQYSEIGSLVENQMEYYLNLKRQERVCFVSEQDFDPDLVTFIKDMYNKAQSLSNKKKIKGQKNEEAVKQIENDKQKPEFDVKEAEIIFNNLLKLFEQ